MDERIFQGMEYVYAVWRAGSFQKAAAELFISQPSVSASVRRVEERIGCQIFDRSVKPLRLTECGQQYIGAVEKILALEREFSEYVNDWGGLRTGRLVLGGSSLFSSLVLPPMMGAFRAKYPQIELALAEETTARLEEMLQSGSIDLVIDYEIPNRELYEAEVLEEDLLILAVPRHLPVNESLAAYQLPPALLTRSGAGNARPEGTPAAASGVSPAPSGLHDIPPVPLQAFREEPFILLKPSNDSRRRADELCARQAFSPRVIMEFDQQMTAYLASVSGIGITFTGTMLVSRMSPHPDLVYYRLEGPETRRQVCMFRRKGRYLTRAMEAFLSKKEDQAP